MFVKSINIWVGFKVGKVVEQEVVDEDITAAYFVQQDTVGSIVEKAHIIPGRGRNGKSRERQVVEQVRYQMKTVKRDEKAIAKRVAADGTGGLMPQTHH